MTAAMTATMTAPALVSPRPSLIGRLLNRWFTAPAATAEADPDRPARSDIACDLRTALEAASVCHVSALSAEYAHYLIDRHSGRMGERG